MHISRTSLKRKSGAIGALLALVIGFPACAVASTITERFEITVADFEFVRNFWSQSYEDVTTEGPSPLVSATLAFTVTYPADTRAAANSRARYLKDTVQDAVFTSEMRDVARVFEGPLILDSVEFAPWLIDSYFHPDAGFRSNVSGLVVNQPWEVSGTFIGSLFVRLPRLFEDVPPTTDAFAEFRLTKTLKDTARTNDSPEYLSLASTSGNWSVTRQIVATSSETVPLPPVPLPSPILALSGGMVLLFGLRRRRRFF